MTGTADNLTLATPTGEPDKRDKWLALLLLITAADIDASRELYASHTQRSLRGIATGDGYTWDAQQQRYVRTATGRAIGGMDVKRLSLLLALTVGHELEDSAGYVASGKTPIDIWQNNTAATVKELAIAQTALAVGGFDQLTPDVMDRLKGDVADKRGLAFSLDRLAGFAQGIALGEPRADTPEAIEQRASLYGAQSNSTFEDLKRYSHQNTKDGQGRLLYLYEANVLGDNENHCGECPRLTDAGWLPIGSMPAPGLRTCGPNCKCAMTYSLTGGQHEHN